jgi:hypothetical protein
MPEPPALQGTWQDPESKAELVAEETDISNTFIVKPKANPEGALRLTLARISPGRYLVQTKDPKAGGAVLLSVAEIDDSKAVVYVFPANLEPLKELGQAHGVILNDDGIITEYASAEGVIAFFEGLFEASEKELLYFNKRTEGQSPENGSPEGNPSESLDEEGESPEVNPSESQENGTGSPEATPSESPENGTVSPEATTSESPDKGGAGQPPIGISLTG